MIPDIIEQWNKTRLQSHDLWSIVGEHLQITSMFFGRDANLDEIHVIDRKSCAFELKIRYSLSSRDWKKHMEQWKIQIYYLTCLQN